MNKYLRYVLYIVALCLALYESGRFISDFEFDYVPTLMDLLATVVFIVFLNTINKGIVLPNSGTLIATRLIAGIPMAPVSIVLLSWIWFNYRSNSEDQGAIRGAWIGFAVYVIVMLLLRWSMGYVDLGIGD